MKKIAFSALLIYLVPSVAFAAWWNPLSWGIFHKNSVPEETPMNTISSGLSASSTDDTSYGPTGPTIADLQRRIAELEEKLQEAQEKLKEVSVSTTPAPAPQPQQQSGIGSSLALSRARSAVVLVETATSSGSGVIIDSMGDILTSAHTILTQDVNTKAVIGFANSVMITFSDGSKRSAQVVGFDEALDAAIVQLSNKTASSYLKLGYDTGVSLGDTVYIASYPVDRADPSLGYGFVSGSVSKTGSSAVEAVVDKKPIDNGGAMISASGLVIGIPRVTSCKVLEEMTNCLKYTDAAASIRTQLPKILAGMRLYRNLPNPTAEESLVQGTLQGMYDRASESSAIDFAVRNVTGQNSFDSFNSRLGDDEGGKVTRIYLNKLKFAAESILQAVDFLKSDAYNLNLFFEDEAPSIGDMGGYQRAILAKIQADNNAKEKEYESKVDYWTKKKNEYDADLADPSNVTHDYLMEEGVTVENAADYLTAEKARVMNVFSGENIAIF
ncbi:MAG TPA: trypsin-like peptidase domain-containing protein [Candidatus Paceibacterota bacterium]|nr:trypsin-like peptidase domain-containing protein [Candidatus Paceibacterota bacterium]